MRYIVYVAFDSKVLWERSPKAVEKLRNDTYAIEKKLSPFIVGKIPTTEHAPGFVIESEARQEKLQSIVGENAIVVEEDNRWNWGR